MFHIIRADENIRSKVGSNCVVPNIAVERIRIDNCYSYIYTRDVEEELCQDNQSKLFW